MKQISGFVAHISKLLDMLAGLCLVTTMLLVVSNILLRRFTSLSILGTYEYVGFLTALVVGLAIANCAVQNGHIAVDFIVNRLSFRKQAIIDTLTNVAALVFWGFSTWYICGFANSLIVRGVVSPTTQMPFYPIVYLVAFGVFALCLVLLVNLLESIKRVAVKR
ncbi:MAG TPA: TRAP transporter small permease [Clostridia bacterium]|nr:TRAP transporter small permease [Clostridia bacterium]